MNEFKNGTSKINMSNTVISDISVTIFSKKTEDDQLNQNLLKKRAEILEELGIYSEPSGTDNFWLFYESYTFPKEEHDRIKAITDKYSSEPVHVEMNCLYDYIKRGTITLDTRVRVSDPVMTWGPGVQEVLKMFFPEHITAFVRIQERGESLLSR